MQLRRGVPIRNHGLAKVNWATRSFLSRPFLFYHPCRIILTVNVMQVVPFFEPGWWSLSLIIGVSLAAVMDLVRYKVFDLVIIALVVLGVSCHAYYSGWAGVLSSLLGMGLGFSAMLAIFSMGMISAYDVKFVASLGACLGPGLLGVLLLAGMLITGMLGLIMIVRRNGVRNLYEDLKYATRRLLRLFCSVFQQDDVSVLQAMEHKQDLHRLVPFSAMMVLALLLIFALRLAPIWAN